MKIKGGDTRPYIRAKDIINMIDKIKNNKKKKNEAVKDLKKIAFFNMHMDNFIIDSFNEYKMVNEDN